MEIYDVVRKLIGPIYPLGETNADEVRYANLIQTIDLIEELHSDIHGVSSFANSKAGKRAAQFLKDIKEW